MNFLTSQSSVLADILFDFDINNQPEDILSTDDDNSSNLVVSCLVKSITKRKKQTPKEQRDLLKIWKAPRTKVCLESPPLLRTDDSYLSNIIVQRKTSEVM